MTVRREILAHESEEHVTCTYGVILVYEVREHPLIPEEPFVNLARDIIHHIICINLGSSTQRT